MRIHMHYQLSKLLSVWFEVRVSAICLWFLWKSLVMEVIHRTTPAEMPFASPCCRRGRAPCRLPRALRLGCAVPRSAPLAVPVLRRRRALLSWRFQGWVLELLEDISCGQGISPRFDKISDGPEMALLRGKSAKNSERRGLLTGILRRPAPSGVGSSR